MENKQLYEERESLSQQVRNWNGSPFVLSNIMHRLEKLKNAFDQIKNLEKEEKRRKKLK
jgi:hypothetical protein